MIISPDVNRDKMRYDAHNRTGFAGGADGFPVRLRPIRGAVAITLIMMVAARGFGFDARDQKQAQGQGAPPDLQITQVKPLAVTGASAATEVEVRWTAQVARLTSIEGFDVFLEVRYSDGSRGAARSEQLKPSARSAILQLATHPRPNGNGILKDFKVTVKARFKIASTLTVVQQVAAAQGNSLRATAGSSGASQPEVFITAAKLVNEGCPSAEQCVDVKWTATAPRNITINEFTVTIDALRKDGTRYANSKTASGTARQARLSAGPTGPQINSIKVSLLTGFSSLDFKTVVKEGTLTQAFSNGAHPDSPVNARGERREKTSPAATQKRVGR